MLDGLNKEYCGKSQNLKNNLQEDTQDALEALLLHMLMLLLLMIMMLLLRMAVVTHADAMYHCPSAPLSFASEGRSVPSVPWSLRLEE